MNEQVKKQSSYFQTRENAAKLGAYYTDPEHCKMIANILEFPEEDVCCLEPAIGDANAICIVTEKEKYQNIHIYGVELNQKTSDTTVLNPYVEECLWGDFLTDVIISHKAFSFCFSNPPYGDLNGTRQEILFLNKLLPYLMIDAVLVYIIPYHVAASQDFQRIWAGALTIEKIFRFHDKEYEKWKQIVLIGRKKDKKSKRRIQSDEVVSEIPKLEEISLLPITYQGERIKVNPSPMIGITTFMTKEFHYERALNYVKKSSLTKLVREITQQELYMSDRLNRPPIMPNAGQMYLMAISGAGQGLVGSEQTEDLHLQRGIVKNVEESEIRESEQGIVEAVRKYAKISFSIVEDSGVIHSI